MRTVGCVVLVNVGRNLNRAYRTCEAYGITRMGLVDCDAKLSGQLYRAAGRVALEPMMQIPAGPGVLALETGAGPSIDTVDWAGIHTVVIGGETAGLPRTLPVDYAHIPMVGMISGLTVEGALAVALDAWRRP